MKQLSFDELLLDLGEIMWCQGAPVRAIRDALGPDLALTKNDVYKLAQQRNWDRRAARRVVGPRGWGKGASLHARRAKWGRAG